ncbi:hypothetical protein VNO78_02986 [Psophocarpus tetragonolobus]|uniref:Uncharacterized protein n=1 Tax=Psophocarpus tetragonolobus TaxID=3891 RepID=A0AAN9SZM7_PSOTE
MLQESLKSFFHTPQVFHSTPFFLFGERNASRDDSLKSFFHTPQMVPLVARKCLSYKRDKRRKSDKRNTLEETSELIKVGQGNKKDKVTCANVANLVLGGKHQEKKKRKEKKRKAAEATEYGETCSCQGQMDPRILNNLSQANGFS